MNRAILIFVLLLLAGCAQKPEGSSDDSVNASDVAYEGNAVDATGNAGEPSVNASEDGGENGSIPNIVAAPAPGPRDSDGDVGIEPGKGAFLEPGDMEVGHWHRVEFALGPDEKAVSTQAEGRALGPMADVSLTPFMRVTLNQDQNFEVRPIGKPVKNLGLDKAASWQWDVRPQSDGNHELVAYVEILREQPDGSFQTLDDYTKRVTVDVKVGTWQGFLNALKNAQTLGDALGTLFRSWEKTLVALAALIAAGFLVIRTIRKKGT